MFLAAVCIEVRRKLQCANVHLTFDEDLSKCQSSLKILLKPNDITIKYNELQSKINLTPYFRIDQESISSLVIEGRNVSFRVLLTNDTGSLDLLLDDTEDDKQVDNTAIKVTLSPDVSYQMKCSNCENTLLDEARKFRRILELPSEFVGISDWFCHRHDDTAQHDLTPKIDDLFFGLYFIVLNFTGVVNVISKERFVYCKRCLKFIGEKLYQNKAVKFWTDTVVVSGDAKQQQQLFPVDSSTQCVRNLIEKILNENLAVSKLHSMQMLKILFETTLPSRKRNFLLFNVMDRNLEILKNTHVDGDRTDVELDECKTMQVLFKVEASEEQPLVNFWHNDFNVQNVNVSYKMFAELVKMLQHSSQLVPEMYRYSNGFCLSYYFMDETQV